MIKTFDYMKWSSFFSCMSPVALICRKLPLWTGWSPMSWAPVPSTTSYHRGLARRGPSWGRRGAACQRGRGQRCKSLRRHKVELWRAIEPKQRDNFTILMGLVVLQATAKKLSQFKSLPVCCSKYANIGTRALIRRLFDHLHLKHHLSYRKSRILN